jgi:hypothetical protein
MKLTNMAQKAVLELLARYPAGLAAETLYTQLSSVGAGHVSRAVKLLWNSGHIKKIGSTYKITDVGMELAKNLELV